MFGGIHLRAPVSSDYRPRRRPIRTAIARLVSRFVNRPITIDSRRFAARGKVAFVIAGGQQGTAFTLGETKTRPGVYVRVVSAPSDQPTVLPRGIVAAVVRGNWGSTDSVTLLEAEGQIREQFGSGGSGETLSVLREAFRGGALDVKAIRLGSGGTKASKQLTAAAVNKVMLTAKHVGERPNGWTITKRVSLADATKNELVTYEGSTILETITFTPGADEAQALTDAVNHASLGSRYWDATFNAVGATDTYTQSAVAGGVEPTIDGAALTTALGLLEVEPYNVLVTDLEDAVSHAAIDAHIDRVRTEGKRIMAVLGEPTTVAMATRRTNAAALNNAAIVYVGNGFETADGEMDGRDAAARVAGMIASAPITGSLTHAVVGGGTDLVGSMTGSEIDQAINSGMLTFTRNTQRQIQVEYGITTLVTPAGDQDAGWKKIRRVRTRDELVSQIVADTDPLVGRVNNDDTGRSLLQARMQGAVNTLIANGALIGGTVRLDPARNAAGDSVWYLVEVDDVDSAEKIYITFGFRFAPPAAAA